MKQADSAHGGLLRGTSFVESLVVALVLAACSGWARPPTTTPITVAPPTVIETGGPDSSASAIDLGQPMTREEWVWAEAMRRTQDTLSPILRPTILPVGLETVRLLSAASGVVQVEYAGPGQRLLIGAGGVNPPPLNAGGVRQSITIREQDATLQVANPDRPEERLWLWWREPGEWTSASGGAGRAPVVYLIAAEGLTPATIQAVAANLATQSAVDRRLGLTIEEYPIVSADVDQPVHLEYLDRLGPKVMARRQAWRAPGANDWVVRTNTALAPFGYRLVPKVLPGWNHSFYDLYRDDALVLADLLTVWPISVNQTGSDFALLVDPLNQQPRPRLVQRDRIAPWDALCHVGIPPVFVGDNLVAVEVDTEPRLIVRCGDEIVYTFVVPPPWATDPVKGLWTWAGHWVVEFDGQVVVDGASLNRDQGYDEVFGWRILAGQPVYFFRAGNRVKVSYAGQTLPGSYDEVVYDAGGEPSLFNARGNETMIWFHARRGTTWLYVELGIYGTSSVSEASPEKHLSTRTRRARAPPREGTV